MRGPSLAYLDLSGFAFSGKHAVTDLMREFRGFYVAQFDYEFNILRIQGGIRDLETALIDDWAPIRSDAAIRRFRRLVDRFASKNSWLNPLSWFHATGWNYEDFFHGQFRSRSEQYINELLIAEWMADWPYPMAEMHACELFRRKLLSRFGMKKAFDVPVVLSAPEPTVFLERTRAYLADLLSAFAKDSGAHTVVMNNSCEPFNPGRALRYFEDGRCIIVDRDPRDNYVAQLSARHPRQRRSVQVSPDIFVKRYRLYRELAARHPDPAGRVLRIHFESLVLDYEATLGRIVEFLEVDPGDHVTPHRYFKPAESSKNVGIWRTFARQDDIEYIGRELVNYCYRA